MYFTGYFLFEAKQPCFYILKMCMGLVPVFICLQLACLEKVVLSLLLGKVFVIVKCMNQLLLARVIYSVYDFKK